MSQKVLLSDAMIGAFSVLMRTGGVPADLMPVEHEDAVSMVAIVMDTTLAAMRYLAQETGHTDSDLLLMLKTWAEIRLSRELDEMYGAET